MKVIILFLTSIIVIVFCGMGEETREYRDPFTPVIHKKKEVPKSEGVKPHKRGRKQKETLNVHIEGIIWSEDMRQVIINGEVYNEGDNLRSNKDAKIIKIGKDRVDIYYRGELYRNSVTSKK